MVYRLPIVMPPPPYPILVTFLAISDQYATFNFFYFFFTKWLPAAILDDEKSISIAFLAISDQYTTFFFHKMAAGGHFGWPKITFDHISRHFRSIRNFYLFFTKWLLIAFLAISDQYATFFSPQNGCQRPFWMTENRFQSHFSPFQINTQLWCLF